MARGSDQATGAATSAQHISDTSASNASGLFGFLAPQLEAQAAHPSGFNPAERAEMDTAALDTAGGGQASAVGQGALQEARTRNAGGAGAAIAKATRTAGETASRGILGNRLAEEKLKESQRQSALGGLGGMFGTSTGASVNSLGEVARNVDANTNAENASWDWAKYILDPAMQAAGGAASGGAFKP